MIEEQEGENANQEDQGTKNGQNGENGRETKNDQNIVLMATTFGGLNFILYMIWFILHVKNGEFYFRHFGETGIDKFLLINTIPTALLLGTILVLDKVLESKVNILLMLK